MRGLEKILEEIENGVFGINGKKKIPMIMQEDEGYVPIHWILDIIRKHMNDGWIPAEERPPEDEARKFVKEELNGIGYLYPCLLTYRSPITERIHVVRFYYDIYEHWFVNAGEEVCEKERCIAWQPLPEPYRPERKEK